MHDVFVHYLEVNFEEVADQLAHARAAGPPGPEARAAASERLRHLVRRLGAETSGRPVAAWAQMMADIRDSGRLRTELFGTLGTIDEGERRVLDRYVDLFFESMGNLPAPAPELVRLWSH